MSKEIKLDKFQIKVYDEPLELNKCITVRAGAGSGKSTTMVAKAQKLIVDGVNPASILMTTFSSKSVLDLKHKYKKMFPTQLKIPHISTLHTLGISILKDYLGIEYQLMNEGASVGLMKKCIAELGFIDEGWHTEADLFPFAKTMLDYIAIYKEQNLGYSLDLLDDMEFNIFEFAEKGNNYFNRIEFKEIAKYYDEIKQEKGLYDFSDLIYEAYHILKDDEDTLELVRSNMNIAIIDEAQDINQLQWDFMMLLFQGQKMVCVGDPMQNIYNFRFSVPENFTVEYLSKFFDTVTPLDLAYNYRSSKEIVQAGNILRGLGGDTLQLIPARGSKKASVEFTDVFDNIQEGTKVAELVKGLVDSGYKPSEIAVITRTNRVLKEIIQPSLVKEDIAYKLNNHTAGTKLMDRLTSDVYFNALSIIYDDSDWFAFVDLMRQILPKNEPFINKLSDLISKHNGLGFELEDSYEVALLGRAKSIYLSLQELAEELEDYSQAGSMLQGLYTLLYRETEDLMEIRKDLQLVYKTILNFWYGLKEEFKMLTVHKTLEAMILRAREYDQDEDSDKITIGSIHSFKGLEHKVSIVCGFTTFRPKKDVHHDLANMVYVQLSRAMDKLIVVNSFNYIAEEFKSSLGYIDETVSMLKSEYKRANRNKK